MTLLNHTYGGIITKGLCLPACCALITAQFSLVCGCSIAVIEGGGGGYRPAIPELYTPLTPKWDKSTRLIIVTVNIFDHKFRKQYVVDREKSDILITIINFVNVIKEKVQVGFGKIKDVTKRVIVKIVTGNKENE